MNSKSFGAFGLIGMVITAGIVVWLHMGKTGGSVPHDVAVIQAGDRAVTALIPACPEAESSCKSPGWSQLTAVVVRRMGLSPGSCMVCSEIGGEKKVTLRMMGGAEREWIQDAAGNIRQAEHGGADSGRPGAMPEIPSAPQTPGVE
jgi:hypothetical protein